MTNWNNLKTAIANVIKTNGNQEITGAVLQNTLNNIINAVGENATFAGIATPTTNPGVYDGPVLYFANQAGVYANFGGIVVDANQFVALYNINGVWQSYEIVNTVVTTAKIVDEAVTTAKIADGAVATEKLANEAITTAKIADEAITKGKLSTDIQALITNISKNASFAGIATPTTNPGTPDGNVFYFAVEEGLYVNFNGIEVKSNEAAILMYDKAWSKETIGLATQKQLLTINQPVTFSNKHPFNEVVKELYIIGDASKVKYYQIHNNYLSMMDESRINIFNLDLTKDYYANFVQKYGLFIYVLIDNSKIYKNVIESEIILQNTDNLKYTPTIVNILCLGNYDKVNSIELIAKGSGYINKDGNIISNQKSRYSEAITVKKGDIIYLKAANANNSFMLSYCDEFATVFDPQIAYSGIDPDVYTFIADRDGYISIGWHVAYEIFTYANRVSFPVLGEIMKKGESAYQIAKNNGFEGTEQEWLDSLKGKDGKQGEKGEKGEKGETGNSGYTGAADELEIVNNLTQGGTSSALSAEMGKNIGDYINYNNVPLLPRPKRIEPIVKASANPKDWTALDGTINSTLIDVFDDVYQDYKKCIECTSTASTNTVIQTTLPNAIDADVYPISYSVCLQKEKDRKGGRAISICLYSDNSFSSKYRMKFNAQFASGNSEYNDYWTRGGWFHCVLNAGALQTGTVVGNLFNIHNVTGVGIAYTHDDSQELSMYIHEIGFNNPISEGGVLLLVDNFNPSVPAMCDEATSRGITLNCSIVPGWINNPTQHGSIKELNRVKRDGHFILNHTWTHQSYPTDKSDILAEIYKADDWMVKNGFSRGSKIVSNPSAVFPNMKSSAFFESNALMIYHHWSQGAGDYQLYYPYYPMSRLLNITTLDSEVMYKDNKVEEGIVRMVNAVNLAIEKKAIAVLGFHGTSWTTYLKDINYPNDGDGWKELLNRLKDIPNIKYYRIDELIEGRY